MTGKISGWEPGRGLGQIAADNGQRLWFTQAGVWPYEIGRLAVGQTVNFDVKAEPQQEAVNVHRRGQRMRDDQADALPTAAPSFRYLGFDQAANVREYRFERLVPGHGTEQVVVGADLTVLRHCQVGLQEGPALCERFLAAAETGDTNTHCLMAEQDILQHRSVPVPKPVYGSRFGAAKRGRS